MRVALIPPRAECQALLLLLRRGVVAALAAPHPFAPTSAMMAPRHCEPASSTPH
jgi:hypothetical protein